MPPLPPSVRRPDIEVRPEDASEVMFLNYRPNKGGRGDRHAPVSVVSAGEGEEEAGAPPPPGPPLSHRRRFGRRRGRPARAPLHSAMANRSKLARDEGEGEGEEGGREMRARHRSRRPPSEGSFGSGDEFGGESETGSSASGSSGGSSRSGSGSGSGSSGSRRHDRPSRHGAAPPRPPMPPPPPPEMEREELLFRAMMLQRQGVRFDRKLDAGTPLPELRSEVRRAARVTSATQGLMFMRKLVLGFTAGVEFLNRKFERVSPLRLDGWGESVHASISEYDGVLMRLAEKYRSGRAMPPELELAVSLAGSAFVFHLTKTLFASAMPTMQDVAKENPELVRKAMDMMAENVRKQQAGQGGAPAAPPAAPRPPAPQSARAASAAPPSEAPSSSAAPKPSAYKMRGPGPTLGIPADIGAGVGAMVGSLGPDLIASLPPELLGMPLPFPSAEDFVRIDVLSVPVGKDGGGDGGRRSSAPPRIVELSGSGTGAPSTEAETGTVLSTTAPPTETTSVDLLPPKKGALRKGGAGRGGGGAKTVSVVF